MALEGMVIGPQHKTNKSYYGVEVSPLDILVKHEVKKPGADNLVVMVSEAASAKQ